MNWVGAVTALASVDTATGAFGDMVVVFVICSSLRTSPLDELLAAVDVEGRAGDRRVRHEVDRKAAMSAGPTTRRIGSVARSCSRRASSWSPRIAADSG